MARWQVTPIDVLTGRANAQAVVVEGETRQDAEAQAFALGVRKGPVATVPADGVTVGDTLACGCRRTGLTRNRRGISYQTVRTSRLIRDVWQCEGCQ